MIIRCSICNYIYDEVEDHPSFDAPAEIKGVCSTCIAKEGLQSGKTLDKG